MALYVNSTVNGLKIGIPGTTPSSKNTAVGEFALYDITSGYRNTAVGHQALSNTTTTIDNTAVGTQVLRDNIGSSNTGIGSYSLLANTSGHSNTCLGYSSGNQISDGVRNICLGYRAGLSITSGSGNTIIGANILGTAALTDTVIIGVGNGVERLRIDSVGSFYNFSTNHGIYTETSLGAGTVKYLYRGSNTNGSNIVFNVWSNGNVESATNSFGPVSDVKLKENIVDANSQWEDFKAVQFRKFNFKEESGYETHTQLGVIAQELEAISPGLVYETPDLDRDGNETGTTTKKVKASVLTMKALVALQEAIAEIETLRARLDAAGL